MITISAKSVFGTQTGGLTPSVIRDLAHAGIDLHVEPGKQGLINLSMTIDEDKLHRAVVRNKSGRGLKTITASGQTISNDEILKNMAAELKTEHRLVYAAAEVSKKCGLSPSTIVRRWNRAKKDGLIDENGTVLTTD